MAAGGTISPGASIGTLTVNSDVTLASGSFTRMEINKTAGTKDQIAGVNSLTYGGTLVVTNQSGTLTTNDAFKLFAASSYSGAFASLSPATPGAGLAWNTNTLAADGTLRIAGSIPPTPVPISWSFGGNTLQLQWPAGGNWTLEVQTNSIRVGLSTNWTRISGSADTNRVSIPVSTASGSVFYRLVWP